MEKLGFETIEAGKEQEYIDKKQKKLKAQEPVKKPAYQETIQDQPTADYSLLWGLLKSLFWIAVIVIGGAIVLANLWFFVGAALFVALVLIIRFMLKHTA